MTKRYETKSQSAAQTDYRPTAQEKDVIEKHLARLKATSSARIKIENMGGVVQIKPDHPNELVGYALLMDAIGSADLNFLNGLLSQIVNASSQRGKIDENAFNFMLAVIKGIEPRDQLETMLAAQMAAVHVAVMPFPRILANAETIQQQDSAERAFNKLTRTFATQMEALKRHRTGGEQMMTVQNVSVSEGGQAFVGNVTQIPREKAPDKAAASPLALTDAKTVPMPLIDESKERERAIVGNDTPIARKKVPDMAAASPPALAKAETDPIPLVNESKERGLIPRRHRTIK